MLSSRSSQAFAVFHVLEGRHGEAEQLCGEALALSQELADRLLTAFFLSILESVASPLQPSHKVWIGDRYIAASEAAMGPAAFDQALKEGRAMSLNQAIQYALTQRARE